MSEPTASDSILLPALEQFEFHEVIGAATGPTLVMFSSQTCGGCRHLRGVLEDVAGIRPDWNFFVVDAGLDAALVHEFEVFHLPTLLLFNDAQFHCELQAPASVNGIVRGTELALQSPAEQAP